MTEKVRVGLGLRRKGIVEPRHCCAMLFNLDVPFCVEGTNGILNSWTANRAPDSFVLNNLALSCCCRSDLSRRNHVAMS